jgi:hypothetical protein
MRAIHIYGLSLSQIHLVTKISISIFVSLRLRPTSARIRILSGSVFFVRRLTQMLADVTVQHSVSFEVTRSTHVGRI